MVKYSEFKPLDFHPNSQNAQRIVSFIHEICQKDKNIITANSKLSGNIYVEDLNKFEEVNADAMSNYVNS
jgi:hypothetical protein